MHATVARARVRGIAGSHSLHRLLLSLCLLSGLISSVWACPTVPQTSYSDSVLESAQVGSVILTVTATINPGETISFMLLNNPTEETSFEIDPVTGNLTLSRALDYETRLNYDLVVYVITSGCNVRVDIAISVENENDNVPQCVQHVLYYSVQESDIVTMDALVTLSCTDGDGMGLTHQIASGNDDGIFSVDSEGNIFANEVLDYESAHVHELSILVQDTGLTPLLHTTVKLFVSVEPVNEFVPEFANSTYEFYIFESASIGSLVGEPVAVDRDLGEDGSVHYLLLPETDSDVFTVCSESGHIYLQKALDFEVTTSYELKVTASDDSALVSSRLTSTATVIVHVLDSNEHTPRFTQSVYYVQVPEGDETETNSNITQLTCLDGDSGPYQQLSYTMVSGNEEDKFEISSSGQIIFKSTSLLDYDLGTQLFELTVQCVDDGQPAHSSNALVVLEITSVNDHDPIPMRTEYEVDVPENTPPGTSIAQVQAVDHDKGLAGLLSYSLTLCRPGLLHINSIDGTVYLMERLDYEAGPTVIDCVASVSDSQQPVRVRQVDIFITVVDVNDESPDCDPSVRLYTIPEDTLPNYIMTFTCNDPDSASLQYTIPSEWSDVPFEVNPTGSVIMLSLQSQLDYENQSAYTFPIQVSDGDFMSVVQVHISVLDTNEHTPTFSSNHFQCNVSESTRVGTVLCETTARDMDGGTLNYQLTNSSENGAFAIDRQTGAVVLTTPIDYEEVVEFTFTVEVSDSGSPVLSSSSTVQIMVVDENDHAPMIKPLIFVAVYENVTSGTVAAVLDCQDMDSGNNGEVSLEIVATSIVQPNQEDIDSPFVINATTGELIVNEPLDYETAQLYVMQVVCKDSGVPSLSTPSTVMIEILPLNEFTPYLQLSHYNVSISEETTVGTSVLQVQAADGDFGADGIAIFSLNSTEVFHIDPNLGSITLIKPLDCTRGTVYHYTVEAKDGGSPSLRAEAELEVHVENCSLGSLVPDNKFYRASISESAPVGTAVLNVSCTGAREGLIGGQYSSRYSMSHVDSAPFELNPVTGQLSVSSPPDYETSPSHLLSLQCYDPTTEDNPLSFSAYISVLPENEHPPQFTDDFYTVEVPENTVLGSSIMKVQAYDLDGGQDGRVTYSIQQADQYFGIDSTAGTVYLTGALDYETTKHLSFEIIAEDNPHEVTNKRYSRVNVTVTVSDSNDHSPECSRSFFHVTASELTAVGTTIAELSCEDQDEGQNAMLEYHISDETLVEHFAVNNTSGMVTLLAALSPDAAVVHLIPVAVRDKGNPPLTSIVVVIVDVQDPRQINEVQEDYDTSSEETVSQTENEGRENSVIMVLRDLTLELWEERAESYFQEAIAHSVTHFCALLPEACSLVSGCSEFYRSRRRRTLDDNYASFMQPNIKLLHPPMEIQAEDSSGVTSLQVQFYVSLPDEATRAPYRQTDYVIPRGTLSQIVQQEGTVVEAVVRDSVAPSLTQPAPEGSETQTTWDVAGIAAVVVAAVLLSVVFLVLIIAVVYKCNKWRTSKNKVIRISPATRATDHRPARTRNRQGPQLSSANTSAGSEPFRYSYGHRSGSSSPNAEGASLEPNSRSSLSSTETDSLTQSTRGQVGRGRGQAFAVGTLARDYLENWPFTPPGMLEPQVRPGHAKVHNWGGALLHDRQFSRNRHWHVS